MVDTQTGPFPLEHVLEQERVEIEIVRENRKTPDHVFSKGKERTAAKAPDAPIPGKTAANKDEPRWHRNETSQKWREVIEAAHKANFVGLAFSGGGIRSATFNLGVLQALAELKLLYRIDYLSTVSGGGYIGGWLAAWTSRLKEKGFAEAQKQLATNRVHQEDDNEPRPIRFLRVFSNYLTPKAGIFSGDTSAMVGIYLRNLILNLSVVLSLLATLLLVPRLVEKWAIETDAIPGIGVDWMWTGIVLLVIAFLTILNNMAYMDCRDAGGTRQLTEQKWVLALTGAPLFFVAILGALWQVARFHQGGGKCHIPYGRAAIMGSIGYGVIWLGTTILGLAYRKWMAPNLSKLSEAVDEWRGMAKRREDTGPKTSAVSVEKEQVIKGPLQQFNEFLISLIGATIAGALAGWLYALLSEQTLGWRERAALTFGAPLVLGIFLLAGTLHIGLMGIVFRDRRREWWGRLGGSLLLWALTWLAVFCIALYFPGFIRNGWLLHIAQRYLTPAWIVTTVGGLLAGNGQATGKPGTQTWKDVLAKMAPYIFVVGLVCWISWGIQQCQSLPTDYATKQWAPKCAGFLACAPVWIADHRLYAALIGCVLVLAIMAWRVDINQFSMHLFYRNRLVRCYLGASNGKRSPNRFTGFDRTDDMPLKDLRAEKGYDGPYPVLNASLNLVKGQDLAWQERKAESFVMTPLFCGYDVWLEEQDSPMTRAERREERPLTTAEMNKREDDERQSRLRRWLGRWLRRWLQRPAWDGYRPTDQYAFPPPYSGPTLGLAMGISGAAASPNMGFYTSAPVAFLMTVFNVRLGQWLGNPRHPTTWRQATPAVGLFCLVNELLGGTDDDAAFVYLSDGGHFENMGLYEMVKRRCGLVILCDAEADGKYECGGLGNAIRKCRIDMGIDIDLDVTDITPQEIGNPSKKHYALGTIHYEKADLNAPTGTIVYFKASLTGDESTDVKNYQKTHPEFPHESTIDQWFSESQFESYRKLGYDVVTTSMQGPPEELREIFADFGFETSKLGVPLQMTE